MTAVGRYAWTFFVAVGVLIVLFGLGDIATGGATYESGEAVLFNVFTGTTWPALRAGDPGAARLMDVQVRLGGSGLLASGLLTIAIGMTALRRGERWAWLTMWVWPLWTGVAIAILLTAERTTAVGVPIPVISGSIILVLAVIVLALSYRRYFPRG